jgi:hypothetical protein
MTKATGDAIGAAVLTMGIVILLYDQLLFRPIVAWAAKFRVELSESQDVESSWVLNLIKRTYWLKSGFVPIAAAMRSVSFWPLRLPRSASRAKFVEVAGPFAADRRAVDSHRHRRRRLGCLAHRLLYRHRSELVRSGARLPADDLHPHPRHRADGARDRGLGADQRLGRPQAPLGGSRSADRPVPRRLSRSTFCSAPR